jgi:uncharacterized delta-60 repeat protein
MRIALAALFGALLVGASSARAGDANFDLTFGTLGVVTTSIGVPNITDVAIQPDGKILATGRTVFTQPLIVRFDASGAVDPTFGTSGIASPPVVGNFFKLALQADGKILFAGTDFQNATLLRLDASGNLDPSFGSGGIVSEDFVAGKSDSYGGIALDPAGKILACGNADTSTGVARYLASDGSLDPTFGVGGKKTISLAANTFGGPIVRQPDGKIIIGGSMAAAGPVLLLNGFLVRLDDAGSADGAFGTNGVVTFDFGPRSDTVGDFALQPDGRIVVTGDSNRAILIARFTSTGALDTTFNGVGYRHVAVGGLDSGRRVILQPDGRIVVVGYTFAAVGQPNTGRWVVLRLLADGTLDPSFGEVGIVRIGLSPTGGVAYNGARQSDGKLVVAGLNGSASVGPLALVRLGGDCGDGTVSGLEVCDDGNAVAGDCCDLACQPEPAEQPCTNSASLCLAHRCDGAGGCGIAQAATGCKLAQEPGRSNLMLKLAPPGTTDLLGWKHRKGDATTLAELGDPYVATQYALCGYGPGPSLLFELDGPPGGLCAGRACWSILARGGFTYRDRDRTPTGLDLLRVRSGDAGRVSLVAKGKGDHLTLPALPLPLPAVVQLRTSDGTCWESTFSAAGAIRNDGTQFRGKSD